MRASRHTSAARGKTLDAQIDLRTIFHSPKSVDLACTLSISTSEDRKRSAHDAEYL